MQQVADKNGVSIDVITYILRKSKVPRRSFIDANRIAFESKKPSFALRNQNSDSSKELDLIGAMLYWAEGYKRNTASGIDFANSDPDMALLFWRFLKHRYKLDLKRLYFSVYHYDDQHLSALVKFWKHKLGISEELFRHSYMKGNSNPNARKLPYGVLHIRYMDKKLLRDVLTLIESYKLRFCVGGGVVNRN
ncbi:MAG: hypothetical protein G01um10148_487 [Parcubacteria group bacterium Gr01-1014_8]|nr:MAG: hypothetical protein G01um10148_487 [Parcubacteria group bacterium Gr01-1014_8]